MKCEHCEEEHRPCIGSVCFEPHCADALYHALKEERRKRDSLRAALEPFARAFQRLPDVTGGGLRDFAAWAKAVSLHDLQRAYRVWRETGRDAAPEGGHDAR